MRLAKEFYQRRDVTIIAKELLGKVLFSKVSNRLTSGMIVETEAYSWREKGCHAYGNKMTARNASMFNMGGCAYVYLCYGIHNMVNIVTNEEGVADAILIRALEPIDGIDIMKERIGIASEKRITSGPGKLAKAMGIDRSFDGKDLTGKSIWIADGMEIKRKQIESTHRIGIDYAGEDALLPWRYYVNDNAWVSKVKSIKDVV